MGSTTTSYTANNLNQYTAISGTTAPTWNTDGGLASYAGNTYTYDAMQRVTEIDYSGGKTLFSYDPLGRRVKKVDANGSGAVLSTVSYHYDGSQVAVEYQPSSVTWTYFGGVMRTDGTNKQWYYQDGHGSTSAVTDNSGNLLEQYEYNAQGQVQIANGSGTILSASAITNDILYAGYRYDNETGNYFCNARYYNPQLGRFISRDPLSGAEFSQGTNLYCYCLNDFLNSIDATGTVNTDAVGKGLMVGGGGLLSIAIGMELVSGGTASPVAAVIAGFALMSSGSLGIGAGFANTVGGLADHTPVNPPSNIFSLYLSPMGEDYQQAGDWLNASLNLSAGMYNIGTLAASEDTTAFEGLSLGFDISHSLFETYQTTKEMDDSRRGHKPEYPKY